MFEAMVRSFRDAASEAALLDRADAVASLLRGADALIAAAAELVGRGGIDAVEGRPVEHVLRTEARLASWDASALTQASDTLRRMPALADAVRDGYVSWSQVRAISFAMRPVAAAQRGAIDAIIGEHAKRLADADPERLIELVQDHAARSRPDLTLRREDRTLRSNFLAIQPTLDGKATLYGEGDAVSMATIVDALDAVADDPLHPDTGVTRAEQRFEALLHVAERTLAGESNDARPRPRVLATIDLADPDDGIRLLWGLTGARPRLSRVTRDELLCDAAITPVVFDGRDVVGVADTTNVFPDKVRTAILARDRRCRFCSRAPASWCDVHHLVPGTGNTARDGCLLCRRCHRTVHRYRWTAAWHDDGTIRFHRRGKHFDSIPP